MAERMRRAGMNEREILYKLLFEMKSDLTDLQILVLKMIRSGDIEAVSSEGSRLVNRVFGSDSGGELLRLPGVPELRHHRHRGLGHNLLTAPSKAVSEEADEVEETLSLVDSERELIRRALAKHGNRRKQAGCRVGHFDAPCTEKIKEFGLK